MVCLNMNRFEYKDCKILKRIGFNHDTSSYFVKGVRVIGAVPSNWNDNGDDYVSLPNVAQAIVFLYKKKGIFVNCDLHIDSNRNIVGFKTTITYTKNGFITYKNNSYEIHETIANALCAGVKNVLKALNKL